VRLYTLFFYRKRYSSLIRRLDELAATTPDTTTSLIKSLARRFTGDFGGSLALIGAFHAFSIAETFFFSVVL
jgi:hypothetical protein